MFLRKSGRILILLVRQYCYEKDINVFLKIKIYPLNNVLMQNHTKNIVTIPLHFFKFVINQKV